MIISSSGGLLVETIIRAHSANHNSIPINHQTWRDLRKDIQSLRSTCLSLLTADNISRHGCPTAVKEYRMKERIFIYCYLFIYFCHCVTFVV